MSDSEVSSKHRLRAFVSGGNISVTKLTMIVDFGVVSLDQGFEGDEIFTSIDMYGSDEPIILGISLKDFEVLVEAAVEANTALDLTYEGRVQIEEDYSGVMKGLEMKKSDALAADEEESSLTKPSVSFRAMSPAV